MSSLSIPKSVHHQRRGSSSKYAVDGSSGSGKVSSTLSKSSKTQKSEPKSSPSLNAPPTTQPLERKRSSLPTLEPPAVVQKVATTNHQSNRSSNRRRSTPTIKHDKSKPQAKKLTKNYTHMVQDYNIMKKYAKQDDGSYAASTRCVFCEIERPRLVFFPCQHMCVCDQCLSANDITSDPTSPGAWTACPVCMTDIRLMLPHTGNEEELYWRWALQAPHVLPLHFKSDFKFAARKLRGSSSSIQPNVGGAESMETPPATTADTTTTTTTTTKPPPATQPAPLKKSRSVATSFSQHSLRRLSLAMRKPSTAGGTPSVAETPLEQQSKCCIL